MRASSAGVKRSQPHHRGPGETRTPGHRAQRLRLSGTCAACRGEAPAAYAGLELACLDAAGKATGRRVCELLGGPVRESVEFAAYLFYRFAADDQRNPGRQAHRR